MVLKFRLISNEQDDFVRDFEILADQTFFHLHMAIQENLHFDKSQIASFFICSENWEKEQEISLFELSEEESARVITMENALIRNHIREVHDKMIYVFDVFNERLLFAELVEIKTQDPSVKYPVCTHEQGSAPQQILMDQLFGSPNFAEGAIMDDASFSDDLPGSGDLEDLGYDSQMLDEDFPDGH